MVYDIAIIYFGLTRSLRKTHETHKKYIFELLQREKVTYKIFMHTWKTKDDKQNVWEHTIPQKIDYLEYSLLDPDYYKLDDEDEFLESVNMDNYFYKDIYAEKGCSDNGEWIPRMVSNHVCMLESQKRGFNMVKTNDDKFKFVMFIRPDVTIHNELPINIVFSNPDMVHIPNYNNYEGLNDQFAIMNYYNASLYGNRIDELADFRKSHGRITGEKYCKFIILKHKMNINQIDFSFSITRP